MSKDFCIEFIDDLIEIDILVLKEWKGELLEKGSPLFTNHKGWFETLVYTRFNDPTVPVSCKRTCHFFVI